MYERESRTEKWAHKNSLRGEAGVVGRTQGGEISPVDRRAIEGAKDKGKKSELPTELGIKEP